MLFALELQRRSHLGGWGVMSNACHPGYARTDLIPNGPGLDSFMTKVTGVLQPFTEPVGVADGALPTLYAATSPDAKGGGYYGPSRMFELVGPPKRGAGRGGGAAERPPQGGCGRCRRR